jgi:DNA-binding response OmpR family regulator
MNGRRIAIVEDDPQQRELLQRLLAAQGAAVSPFESGEALMRQLRRDSYDLLVVDWNLPGMPGPQIVRTLREAHGSDVPVLMVTNRSMEADIVAGLSAGADDYLVKPYRAGELAARIGALLRRAFPADKRERLRFGPYEFDLAARSATRSGQAVELQPREFDLAVFFFNNLGRLLSRAHLIEGAWQASGDTLSRSLDTQVSRLRSKLALSPATGFRLSSVYGHGYRLDEVQA